MYALHSIGVAAFLMFASPVVGAASLLPNGDFSSAAQLSQWTQTLATMSWNADDAGGSGSSGSLELDAPAGAGASAQSACFSALSAITYTYGGQSKVINTGPTTISFSCTAYSDSVCLMNASALPAPAMSTGANWTTPASASGVLPTGTSFVQCTVSTVPSPIISTSVRFDNLMFGPTTTPVRLQSFDVK